MSIRPKSAVVCAVTDAVPTRSGRLASVLEVGMRSVLATHPFRTGTVYSNEPPAIDHDDYFGYEEYANRDPRWDTDLEWAMEQVRSDPREFVFASTEFRKTKRFAMAMVAGNGYLLDNLSDLFKHDREIITAALRSTSSLGSAYDVVPEELKGDDEIIRTAFESAGEYVIEVYEALPDSKKLNRAYMILAVKANALKGFREIPKSAQNDRAFVIDLIEQNVKVAALRHVRNTYKDNRFWADVLSRTGELLIIPPRLPKTRSLLLAIVSANGDVLTQLASVQRSAMFAQSASIFAGDHLLANFFDFGDYRKLEKDPEIRIAAATARRNPNVKMIGALIADLDASIHASVVERSIVEDEAMKGARMRRLQAYSDLLDKLVISVATHGPMATKIAELEELVQLLNDPNQSKDFVMYRFEDLEGTMMDDEQPSAKRARYATEASALAAGLAMDRISVTSDVVCKGLFGVLGVYRCTR